jgi:hypothetical protein
MVGLVFADEPPAHEIVTTYVGNTEFEIPAGKRIYGIAVDDAHHFTGEFAADRANPGRGWVAVKAPRLDPAEVMTALEDGRFYASTGVELDDVVVSATTIEVRIRQKGDFRYTTDFIGDNGLVLSSVAGTNATFDLSQHRGRLSYVRARVDDSGGFHAWVQPVFISAQPAIPRDGSVPARPYQFVAAAVRRPCAGRGGAGSGIQSKKPNIISSKLCSPNFTGMVGSGFAGLPALLSYHARPRSVIPGSMRMSTFGS